MPDRVDREVTDEREMNKRERAELEALRDNQQRLIAFDGGAVLMPWATAHKHHKDEPYIGCLFCRDQFVARSEMDEALAAIRPVPVEGEYDGGETKRPRTVDAAEGMTPGGQS